MVLGDQDWSSWEWIAQSYAKASNDSKLYAYDLAQIYACNTLTAEQESMVSLFTKIEKCSAEVFGDEIEQSSSLVPLHI